MPQLEVVRADITQLPVEAIVNAANTSLLGGGGVDGAIHRAAGPELLAACRLLQGCPTGSAKATSAFALPAKWIFHAVGPVWHGGRNDEDAKLAACYRTCLDLAQQHAVRSIAFPAISTGVYCFPKDRAAAIALATVQQTRASATLDRILFCCFDQPTQAIYETLISANRPASPPAR